MQTQGQLSKASECIFSGASQLLHVGCHGNSKMPQLEVTTQFCQQMHDLILQRIEQHWRQET